MEVFYIQVWFVFINYSDPGVLVDLFEVQKIGQILPLYSLLVFDLIGGQFTFPLDDEIDLYNRILYFISQHIQ